MAMVSQIAAAEQGWADEFPPVGHRPPGTQEARADIAKEGRALQEKMYTEADVHKMLECDAESEAPTEGGEEGRALKRAKKAEKLKARAAKREKLKDSSWSKVKVMAKIGKS